MNPRLPNLPSLILIALLVSTAVQSRAEDCFSNLPDSIRSAVEQDHWTILQSTDLPLADAKVFRNAHQGQCPGVAVGNFHPKGDKSYAIALIQQDDQKNILEKLLVVYLKKDQPRTEIAVPPTQVPSPFVVWRLVPGHYSSFDGKQAGISRDSFVYEKIDALTRQFFYQGSHLESFVISN